MVFLSISKISHFHRKPGQHSPLYYLYLGSSNICCRIAVVIPVPVPVFFPFDSFSFLLFFLYTTYITPIKAPSMPSSTTHHGQYSYHFCRLSSSPSYFALSYMLHLSHQSWVPFSDFNSLPRLTLPSFLPSLGFSLLIYSSYTLHISRQS